MEPGRGRLVAVLALLAGLLGLHGLSAAAPGGQHHLPTWTAPTADGHAAHGDLHGEATARPPGEAVELPADNDSEHGAIAGCVLVLAALALTALLARFAPIDSIRADRPTPLEGLASAPLHGPPRISLCVLRV